MSRPRTWPVTLGLLAVAAALVAHGLLTRPASSAAPAPAPAAPPPRPVVLRQPEPRPDPRFDRLAAALEALAAQLDEAAGRYGHRGYRKAVSMALGNAR